MRFLQNAVLAAVKRVQLFLDEYAALLAALVDLTMASIARQPRSVASDSMQPGALGAVPTLCARAEAFVVMMTTAQHRIAGYNFETSEP
jgi:hypothetical protein